MILAYSASSALFSPFFGASLKASPPEVVMLLSPPSTEVPNDESSLALLVAAPSNFSSLAVTDAPVLAI